MKIVLFSILCFLYTTVEAQVTKPKPRPAPTTPIAKGKVPKLTADIGGMATGVYSAGAIKILIDSNLVVKDENGKRYPISRCTFLYKRKMSYKDEESGETKVTWEYLGRELRDNEQLDSFWRTTIKEDLKKGEALIFEKIMADSKKGYMIPVKGFILTVQ